jgi:hypothetical protein
LISKELILWGNIIIPNPHAEAFQSYINQLKGHSPYTDFPDFIMSPIMTSRDPIATFGYIYRYEEKDEIEMIKRFEKLLKKIQFLSAVIQIEIGGINPFVFEYVFDGEQIHKFERLVNKDSSQGSII